MDEQERLIYLQTVRILRRCPCLACQTELIALTGSDGLTVSEGSR